MGGFYFVALWCYILVQTTFLHQIKYYRGILLVLTIICNKRKQKSVKDPQENEKKLHRIEIKNIHTDADAFISLQKNTDGMFFICLK